MNRKSKVEIYHPALDATAVVPARSARILALSGWISAADKRESAEVVNPDSGVHEHNDSVPPADDDTPHEED